jgi:hypothetical protein
MHRTFRRTLYLFKPVTLAKVLRGFSRPARSWMTRYSCFTVPFATFARMAEQLRTFFGLPFLYCNGGAGKGKLRGRISPWR